MVFAKTVADVRSDDEDEEPAEVDVGKKMNGNGLANGGKLEDKKGR